MAEDTIFKFIEKEEMNNVKTYLDNAGVDSQLDEHDNTALIFAAMHGKKEIVEQLLTKEPDVNAKNEDGDTALILASKNGHTEIVKLLIKEGADVDKTNNDGWTALMLAAFNGRKDIVELLIKKKADVDKTDNDGWTAIALARKGEYTGIVDALKKAGAKEEGGHTATHTVTTGQPQSNIVRNNFLLSYEQLKKWLGEKPEEKVLNIANEISDLSKLKQIVLDSSQVPSQTVKMELYRGTINVLKIPFFSTYNGWSNWLPSSVEQSLPNVQMFNIDGEDLHIIIQKIPFNFGKDFEVEDNPGKVRMVYRPHFYEYKGEDIKKNSDIQNFFYLKYKIIGDNGDWSTEHIDEIEKLQEMKKMEKKQGGNATILHNWFLIRDETNLSASLNAEQMKDFNKWKDSAIYFRDNWHIHKINNESTLSPAQDEKNQSKSSVLLRDMLRSFNLNKNEGNMVKVYLKHKSVNGDFEGLFIFLRSEDYDNFFIPPLPHLEENHKESGVEESKSDDSDTGENDYKKNPILTSTQQRPPPPRRANNLTRDEAGEERSKSKKSSNKPPPPPAPTPDKRLLTAAKSGNKEGVKRALEAGADVKAKNKEGNTALMLASGEGHTEIVKLLEEAVKKKSKVEKKTNQKHEAKSEEPPSLPANPNRDLRNAAKDGDLEGAKSALENLKVKVDTKDKEDNTALMLASKNGHTEIVKLLIEKGADVNAKNKEGNTTLMLAIENSNKDIVKLLIEKGADVNAKDSNGNTALMLAIENSNKDIVKELIDVGAYLEGALENVKKKLLESDNKGAKQINNLNSIKKEVAINVLIKNFKLEKDKAVQKLTSLMTDVKNEIIEEEVNKMPPGEKPQKRKTKNLTILKNKKIMEFSEEIKTVLKDKESKKDIVKKAIEDNEKVKELYRHFKATLEKKNINPRELLEK